MTTFNQTYDIVTPAGSDSPAEADDRMREIKAAVQERENVDHYWPLTGTEVSDADSGEHRKVTLRTGSAPLAVADKGFVYAKDVGGKAELFYIDEDGNEIQLTSKGQYLANDTFLTATDEVGTGSVDLIKAGKNEADDADVAIISDAARMETDVAPDEDTGIVPKKYVDDQITAVIPSGLTGANGSAGETAIGELQLKWGQKSQGAVSFSPVTFSTAFDNACFKVFVSFNNNDATIGPPASSSPTATNFVIRNNSGATRNIDWLAIGR